MSVGTVLCRLLKVSYPQAKAVLPARAALVIMTLVLDRQPDASLARKGESRLNVFDRLDVDLQEMSVQIYCKRRDTSTYMNWCDVPYFAVLALVR